MNESKTTGDKTISVAKPRLTLKRGGGVERDSVRQTFSHGRTNTVQVERKKRRVVMPGDKPDAPVQTAPAAAAPVSMPTPTPMPVSPPPPPPAGGRAEPARSGMTRTPPTMDRHAAARAGLVLKELSSD